MMQFPQIVVLERDRRLTTLLADVAKKWRWALRGVRRSSTCEQLLQENDRCVLVLRVGRNVEEELCLLARVTERFSSAKTIVIGEEAHVPLGGLAWDLGAAYVMFLPFPRDWLAEIVEGMLRDAPERPMVTIEEDLS